MTEAPDVLIKRAIAIYTSIAVGWTVIVAIGCRFGQQWLSSGFAAFLAGPLSALCLAVQYDCTCFFTKFTLSNDVSLVPLIAVIAFFIIVCVDDTTDFDWEQAAYTSIMPAIVCICVSLLLCLPYWQWQYLRISDQLLNSPGVFNSAAHHYLQKALNPDDVQKILFRVKSAVDRGDYPTARFRLGGLDPRFYVLPEIQEYIGRTGLKWTGSTP